MSTLHASLDDVGHLSYDQAMALRDRATNIFSSPKCGRTWLRFMLACYIDRALGLGVRPDMVSVFRIIPNDRADFNESSRHNNTRLPVYAFADRPDVPVLTCRHDRFAPELLGRPFVLLARSIPSTIASLYAYKRGHGRDVPPTLAEFVRQPGEALDGIIDYYNGWAQAFDSDARWMHVTYERLHEDAESVLGSVVRFIGLELDSEIVRASVADGSLDRMRALEAEGSAWDLNHPDRPRTVRVRRGAADGGKDELAPDDLDYIQTRCDERLQPPARRLLGETRG